MNEMGETALDTGIPPAQIWPRFLWICWLEQWIIQLVANMLNSTWFCCELPGNGRDLLNSLAPGKFKWNFGYVIFKRVLVIDGWGISCEIALIWISLYFTDNQSRLVQVMAWCCQATSHYLSQCWPRSMMPYGVTRPQWVNLWPSDTIPWSASTLAQAMACCLTATIHDLNQCWLLISEVLWHSLKSKFRVNAQASILYIEFQNHFFLNYCDILQESMS